MRGAREMRRRRAHLTCVFRMREIGHFAFRISDISHFAFRDAKPDISHFAHFAGAKPDTSQFRRFETGHFAGFAPRTLRRQTLSESVWRRSVRVRKPAKCEVSGFVPPLRNAKCPVSHLRNAKCPVSHLRNVRNAKCLVSHLRNMRNVKCPVSHLRNVRF